MVRGSRSTPATTPASRRPHWQSTRSCRAQERSLATTRRAVPCFNQSTFFVYETSALADGPHTARLTYTDAGNNTGSLERTFHVDNHPPEPVDAMVAGGEGWRARATGSRSAGRAPSRSSLPSSVPITASVHSMASAPRRTRSGAAITEIANLPVEKARRHQAEGLARGRGRATTATSVPGRCICVSIPRRPHWPSSPRIRPTLSGGGSGRRLLLRRGSGRDRDAGKGRAYVAHVGHHARRRSAAGRHERRAVSKGRLRVSRARHRPRRQRGVDRSSRGRPTGCGPAAGEGARRGCALGSPGPRPSARSFEGAATVGSFDGASGCSRLRHACASGAGRRSQDGW